MKSEAQHRLTCWRIAGRPHDVQVAVLLAGERGGREVLHCRAGSDRVGGLLAEPGDRGGDRRGQIVGYGDPFERSADLRAERGNLLPVIRLEAREPINRIVERRCFSDDPPEAVRRDTEAGRYADAFDPRELTQVRALATNDRDLRLVDLIETQHIVAHLSTPLRPHCQHARVLATAPPWCILIVAERMNRCSRHTTRDSDCCVARAGTLDFVRLPDDIS